MPDPARVFGRDVRHLTFRVAEQLYAVSADEVAEVIRTPQVARVPQAPESLMGLANLRGTVLPVASVRSLLGYPKAEASRAIVLNGGAPVALAVDEVEGLVAVDADHVETRQAELATREGERITGAFAVAGGEFAKVLDVRSLLASAFTARPRAPRQAAPGAAAFAPHERRASEDAFEKLVTFEVAGQEFGLPIASVREIVPPPASLTAVPRGEALVLGVTAYRDSLLPLLSLRGLLGLGPSDDGREREKVVIAVIGGVLVGLVVDRTRAIVAADPALVEPIPPVLAARAGGESRVKAIFRGEGGKRLISILAAEQLFREDVMQRLSGSAPAPQADDGEAVADGELRLLVFRLGEDEFALPIDVVDEVARVPEQVTRVPKTPKFLEGVVNLRGGVLPVIDQRRRFDMPMAEDREGRRLIVVRTERHRAGVIVDSVSEVLRSTPDAVEPAPDLTGEATRLVHGVVTLDSGARIVLLLDPSELLTRAERGLLDAFTGDAQAPA